VPGSLAPRPSLPGDADYDVAIVGAGFTGLWTAYALARQAPDLRIAVLEAEIAGYGPSGRNGGFVSAGIAGQARVYERTHGADGVKRAERAVIEAIDWIGEAITSEHIDCGYVKGGSLRVATSEPQLLRVQGSLRARRERGFGEEDARLLSADEVRERVQIAGACGGAYTPHCARIDPARLVRGLAEACERRGVTIHERTRVSAIEPGRAVCESATVRAEIVVRATESYTTRLEGERRRYLPVFSHMVATEPLPAEIWEQIGWSRGETLADQHHHFFYAQRTGDDRIAIGGCGTPYRFGSGIREEDEQNRAVFDRLERAIRRHFPQAAGARITHRWGGPFAAPRDWCMSVDFDRATGLALVGGYSGHGVVGSNVAGRTAADLVLGLDTDLVSLPWVGHRCRRWEPEPIRWLATRVIPGVLASADRAEDRTGRPARRVKLVARWLPGR
jgi:glycine/D-amino acid oxidase-like deaminating enzyme